MSDKIEPKIVCGCCGGSKTYIPLSGPPEACGTCKGEGVVDNPALKPSDVVPPMRSPDEQYECGKLAALQWQTDLDQRTFAESELPPLDQRVFDESSQLREGVTSGRMIGNGPNYQSLSRVHRKGYSDGKQDIFAMLYGGKVSKEYLHAEVIIALDNKAITLDMTYQLAQLPFDKQIAMLPDLVTANDTFKQLTALVAAEKTKGKYAKFRDYFNKSNFAFFDKNLGKTYVPDTTIPKYEVKEWTPPTVDYEDIIDEAAVFQNIRDKQVMMQKARQMGKNFQLQMEASGGEATRKWLNDQMAATLKEKFGTPISAAMIQVGDEIYADFETSK